MSVSMPGYITLMVALCAVVAAVGFIIWHALTQPQLRGFTREGDKLYYPPVIQADTARPYAAAGAALFLVLTVGLTLGVATFGAGPDTPATVTATGFLYNAPDHLIFLKWAPERVTTTTTFGVWDEWRQVPGGQTHKHGAARIVMATNLTMTMTLTFGTTSTAALKGAFSSRGDKLTLELPQNADGTYPPSVVLIAVTTDQFNAAATQFGNATPLPTLTPTKTPPPTKGPHGHV